MDNNLILSLENEYENEIEKEKVSIEDLKHLGVLETTLQQEALLRGIYGDGFIDIENSVQSNIDDTKKTITRISLNEIEKISVVKELMEGLKDTEFNKNLNMVTIRLRNEDDE